MTWRDDIYKTCLDAAMAETIVSVVDTLLERDAYLFIADVHERTIGHRFAVYLEHVFPEWHVDCEYNRDGHVPKEIGVGYGNDGEHGSRVFPDVIVHKRATPNNFLVVELKKSNNPESDNLDFEKLRKYCTELGYVHGLFIRFSVGQEVASVSRAAFVYA